MSARPAGLRLPLRSDGAPMAVTDGGASHSDPFEAPVGRAPRMFHALYDDAPGPAGELEDVIAPPAAPTLEPPRKRARREASPASGMDVPLAFNRGQAPRIVPYRRWAAGARSNAASDPGWADDDDLAAVDAQIAIDGRGRATSIDPPDEPRLDDSCTSALAGLLDLRGVSPLRRQREADAQLTRELWGSVLQEPTREPPEGLADLSDDDVAGSSSGSEDDEARGWDRPEL